MDKIISYAKRYSISDDGKVKSYAKCKTGKYLKPSKSGKDKRGYLFVDIALDIGIYRQCQIHRLVAEAFIPNPDNKPCVNHKDGNKLNNNVSNLEWVTYKENTQHALNNNLLNPPIGERSGSCKISEVTAKNIVSDIISGKTNKEISEIYGLSNRHISSIRTKSVWKHLWPNGYNNSIVSAGNGRFKSNIPENTRMDILKDIYYNNMKNIDIAKKYNLPNSATVSKIKHPDRWKDVKTKLGIMPNDYRKGSVGGDTHTRTE